jgi:hypothetical protein
MAGHAGFRHPGQPGHAAHPGHFPTPEDSLGSPAGDQPHLEAPARGAGLWHQSMGLSFGVVTAPVTSGHSPHRSSVSFFFILALGAAVK